MGHYDDERYDIIRQPPFQRVKYDHNKPSSTRGDTVNIDISKLKSGDWYYTLGGGWVGVHSVHFRGGFYEVYGGNDCVLLTNLDGSNPSGNEDWAITKVKTKEEMQHDRNLRSDTVSQKKVVSDGGSSSYYLFPQSLVDLVIKTGKLETKDIIRHGFGNDNDFGNVFKALKRLYELKLGGGKDGSTAEYEVNKMQYFLDEILEDLK